MWDRSTLQNCWTWERTVTELQLSKHLSSSCEESACLHPKSRSATDHQVSLLLKESKLNLSGHESCLQHIINFPGKRERLKRETTERVTGRERERALKPKPLDITGRERDAIELQSRHPSLSPSLPPSLPVSENGQAG